MTSGSVKLPSLEPGTPVGEYVVKHKIGEGGMGQVYAGEQPLIGKRVAIKVLSAELAEDQNQVQRLLAEARAVNLIHHPNIIDIFAFGELPDHRPYFVMELLEGESLEATLSRNDLSPADLTALMEQLCQTLGAAHDAGFVHRDLKPDNLWLLRKSDHTPFLKILDFGIAKNIRGSSPGLTVNGQVLGTAHYMAPEQALARTVDARTDIYAIGVILYRILAGVLPFEDPNLYTVITKQVTETPRPLSFHRKVPADIEGVVMRCLAKEPEQRPQTVSQLWREIRPALAAWQAASVGMGLAETRWAPDQASAIAASMNQGSAHKREPNSGTTIQPVERSLPKTRRVALEGKNMVGISLVAAITIAGGIVLYSSLPRPRSPMPQPSIAPLDCSYDSADLNMPASAGAVPKIQLGAVEGERDSGASGSTRPPPPPPAQHHPKKVSRENDNPVRL
jgi:serine/threonine-protein kinase